MDSKPQKIQYRGNRGIQMSVTPGHFATNHSHINYYVDMMGLKAQHKSAKEAAGVLAEKFSLTTPVDTIICLEGTEIIGAFVADALSQTGAMAMNSGANISILTPELNVNNQMIFQHNTHSFVAGKSILLLLSSITTGKTIYRAVDCLQYYGGRLSGIGAIFSARREVDGNAIHSIFTETDLPHYETYRPHECEMCKQGRKIDAIVNAMGFTPI